MRKRIFKLGGLLVLFALAVCVVASTAWAKPRAEVVVIGDSLSDPGNLYDLTNNFFPISPPYAERFSNGPVWAEYFAARHGLTLDDRAIGGSFTGPILLPLTDGTTYLFDNYDSYAYGDVYGLPLALPGVQQQVESLISDHPDGLNPRALYVVWAGANDFFAALENPTNAEILPGAVQNIVETICHLGRAGARHFAVANLPDIGLTPFGLSLGEDRAKMVTGLAAQFNEALEAALAALVPECAETLVLLDAFDILQKVVAEPRKYGFVNADTPCMAVPHEKHKCKKYLFWDEVHPTTAGHALFAKHFWAALCGRADQHYGPRGRPVNWPPAIRHSVCGSSN